ncbi:MULTISPECIES: 2Fe-2S iron-sulfur cluster-binding protein [Rhodobacterales]|jgi:2Fe-2S ferredoxin|uniref:2Fe-2S iron-sulfur cluster-binding protein n=1 Tax=Phaeobacter gallaeciensis TaxID=60890 RepID=A0AAW6L223_9RHOB|nr:MULTISPECIES: 2Fe-2S iron-sulfur cluster-binding protein [Phaeobacter]MDF1772478.1 2Fe-2S iron-sulfur cluster-binding protein [Pseudophaeobacter sp. bin_em_oilr2.035]MDE4059900.1 2Fe-2S iron-sulfur cluster-binding protein [Phaeobacter gallaeciensis]MDE4123038.1 2Fe-2S iron-sulfur cluster-binding protein [Phaeobacter gallaeciensis]MDE4127388.1 2Fe-2S iron-sulfur cluster-binding protein [Phaeobacter gallaeciensis]MDE4140389.1 2Fe-2S iron-sulfur cluster-binding protein [Phaeobacter gallaeciens
MTVKVTWKLPDGTEITGAAENGQNLMQAALAHDVPGIIGECGGTLSCATCHVYVDPAWSDKCGAPEDFEDAMLDMAEERRDSSRLSCQIEASPDLDGLVLIVPEE